jgi:hypothetical protein
MALPFYLEPAVVVMLGGCVWAWGMVSEVGCSASSAMLGRA